MIPHCEIRCRGGPHKLAARPLSVHLFQPLLDTVINLRIRWCGLRPMAVAIGSHGVGQDRAISMVQTDLRPGGYDLVAICTRSLRCKSPLMAPLRRPAMSA